MHDIPPAPASAGGMAATSLAPPVPSKLKAWTAAPLPRFPCPLPAWLWARPSHEWGILAGRACLQLRVGLGIAGGGHLCGRPAPAPLRRWLAGTCTSGAAARRGRPAASSPLAQARRPSPVCGGVPSPPLPTRDWAGARLGAWAAVSLGA
jgi:hypothetical protein